MRKWSIGLIAGIMNLNGSPAHALSLESLFKLPGEATKKILDISEVEANRFQIRHYLESRGYSESQYTGTESVPGLKTFKSEAQIDGVPVLGGMVFLHRFANGEVKFTDSLPKLNSTLEAKAQVSREQALRIASLESSNPLASPAELRWIPKKDRSGLDLVWWVDFRSTDVSHPGVEVVVDAQSGAVRHLISKMHTVESKVYNARDTGLIMLLVEKSAAKSVSLFRKKRGFVPSNLEVRSRPLMRLFEGEGEETPYEGCIVFDPATKKKTPLPLDLCIATVEGTNSVGAKACQIINATDGQFFTVNPENCELYSVDGKVVGQPDPAAEMATENAEIVYDYFSDRFGRRSFDGKASTLRSVVHVGYKYANAAWMGDLNFMVYGSGDGEEMGDFTELLDVAGHEMTHGVVNSTAKLKMMDEPGALNEATADYFGLQLTPNHNWEIGVGLYKKDPNAGLRSIWNPGKYSDTYVDENGREVKKPNPAKYSERYLVTERTQCNESNDRCFVHMNSTIMSHGYYQIHRALGKSKTQDLVFRALTHYYRPTTDFHEAADLLRTACADLYDGITCEKVDAALKKVEL